MGVVLSLSTKEHKWGPLCVCCRPLSHPASVASMCVSVCVFNGLHLGLFPGDFQLPITSEKAHLTFYSFLVTSCERP